MIKVQNLSFQYRKDLPLLLNDLSFDVNQGTVLTILGKNGVGKTTFLRCLTGELSSYTGNIYIDQKEVRDYSISDLSQKIALVASNSPCYQNLSVADFLVTGFANRLASLQSPSKRQYAQALDVLTSLGQEPLFNRYTAELSSGEMQMVKIARAILQEPSIIVFDEPTSNLDIKNQLLVLEQISALTQRGFTVITTTHNPGQTLELGGYALLLTGDHQIFGNATDILTEENLCAIYGLYATIENGVSRNYASFLSPSGSHRLVF